jgi:hypothetical protein
MRLLASSSRCYRETYHVNHLQFHFFDSLLIEKLKGDYYDFLNLGSYLDKNYLSPHETT